MAGQALTKVEQQINIIKNYADESLDAAKEALSTLSELDISSSYPTTYYMTGGTIQHPDAAVRPDGIGTLDTAPAIDSISIPSKVDKPDIGAVEMGSIYGIALPDVPTISFPSLDITAPVYNIQNPSQGSFSVSNILISDDPLIQAAITRLTNNVVNGGTGLSAAVEAAIFARGKEREEQQLEDSIDKATSMWAKRGFALPDGELANSLMALQTEYLNKQLDRSREIEIKQADLEQANLFKSLELSISLAGTLIDMLIKYEDLVLRSQEDIAKFANEYLSLQIQSYNSKVEAYKATAQVHEMIIRAELAKVEVYRAQIEGQKVVNEVNAQTVQIYSERIKATSLLIERYRTEVQAMVSELETEKLKIESNKLQMDAWATKANVAVSKYVAEVDMYKAESGFNVATSDLYARQYEAGIQRAISMIEMNIRSTDIAEKSMLFKANLAMAAAKGVADATASLASGAMAAMSAHASMSYGESVSYDGGEV